jgi:hypothetical protein
MASNGYLLVQWRNDGDWFSGQRKGYPRWTTKKSRAMRFQSTKAFREYESAHLTEMWKFRWSTIHIRFVRVRPRKEAA